MKIRGGVTIISKLFKSNSIYSDCFSLLVRSIINSSYTNYVLLNKNQHANMFID